MPKPSPRAVSDFEALKERHQLAVFTELESGAALVSLPLVLPAGWNIAEVTLRFIIPNGYPTAQPDCFWVEPNLVVSGGVPGSSAYDHAIPETQLKGNWFSWHIEQGRWSPNRDNLNTWLCSCRTRLAQIK